MAGDITPYTNLITSEHNQQPKFMATVAATVQPFADSLALLGTFASLFDLDVAVGQQLDILGQWIGASRELSVPLTGVYFSLDTAGVGFDQGTWYAPYDSTTELTSLPDDAYRTLLRAKIADNQWEGNVPSAYAFLDTVFPAGDTVIIQDNEDMTMLYGVVGPVPLDAVSTALLENGELDVKPMGVRINGYVTASVPGSPLFGFNVENSTISGFDVGGWASIAGGR